MRITPRFFFYFACMFTTLIGMDKVPWFLVGAKHKHLAVLDEDTPFDGAKGYAYQSWRSLATQSKSLRLVEVWMGGSSCSAKRRILQEKLATGFFISKTHS